MSAPSRKLVSRSLHRLGLLTALGVLLVLACGRRTVTAPPAEPPPPEPLPTRIEAVYPPARSTGVFYETEVWLRFSVALDPATVNDRFVYFLQDTRRLATTLTWDSATRTLHIVPVEGLLLQHTYTIELSTELRFSDGATLGQSFISQFTTNSVRRVQDPLPMDGKRDQSPFVALSWGGLTGGPAGSMRYEVHAAADSAEAADPSRPALETLLGPRFVPRTRWRQDGTTFWSIHAINVTTGERLVGPVWRFDAVPAGTPYDSVLAAYSDFTWMDAGNRNHCSQSELQMGPGVVCTYRWVLGPPDTTVRLAGAAIEMTAQPGTPPPGVDGPSVWYATASWTACDIGRPGPPYTDEAHGRLADAFVPAPNTIRFASDALAAHVEATRRFGGYYGYLFRSESTRRYWAPYSAHPSPILWLYFYR